jgi:hypothetical protein
VRKGKRVYSIMEHICGFGIAVLSPWLSGGVSGNSRAGTVSANLSSYSPHDSQRQARCLFLIPFKRKINK